MSGSDYSAMLEVAIAEARKGLAEGGIPIGAAIFDESGKLLGAGHNRRVQNGDPSLHGETDAFRKYCLLNGLDDIGLTLRHAAELDTYETQHDNEFWLKPRPVAATA